MPESFTQRIIAAHQAGLKEREAEDAKAMQAEDRKIQKQLLKHQMDKLKIDEALEKFKALQGQKAPEVQVGQPGTRQPVVSDVPEGGVQPIPAPIPSGFIQEQPMPSVSVPFESGAVQLQPQSMQEILRQQKQSQMEASQAKFMEPYTLNEGDVRNVGATTIASNPKPAPKPTEKNQQFRDVERGGKIVRQYFDGVDPSKVTFEVDTGTVKERDADPLTAYQRNQTFLGISNRYQADSIVNQSIKGQTAKTIADQVIANPGKATNQLASLYLYVKNLDADSAVREGEIGLARQTQSYFQTFGTSLARVNAGQVISPEAATELAKATKELVAAWEGTAKTRTAQYKSQAATAGIGSQFDQYLAGFSAISGSGGGKKPITEMSKDEILQELLNRP